MNLEADIFPASGTGKSSTLAWHHNLKDLMLGAGCRLEIPELVLSVKYLKRLMKAQSQPHQKMHSLLVF